MNQLFPQAGGEKMKTTHEQLLEIKVTKGNCDRFPAECQGKKKWDTGSVNYIFHYENCDFHKEQYVKRLLNNEAVAFLISERPTEKNIVSETKENQYKRNTPAEVESQCVSKIAEAIRTPWSNGWEDE